MTNWVFQCNPERYPIHEKVAESRDERWNTPRYRSRIAMGDRVFLASVGAREPGVHYIATVLSPPHAVADDEFGRWHSDIRFDYRIDPFLPRAELLSDTVLADCSALRGFQGSNQPIAEEYGDRLWHLAQGGLHALDPQSPALRREDTDIGQAIERHTGVVRGQLIEAIKQLSPLEFELLVVRILRELEFDVKHVGQTGDGGIDAEAVLSLRGLTAVHTKVQAKRWGNTVGSRTVRELRGALRIDERGLIITTNDFSSDARAEAQAEGKARIGVLSGDDLVGLCLERGIGVTVRRVQLYDIDPAGLRDDSSEL